MKELLLKIISGGQTGADTGGLIAAQKAGIRTGGCAPKGFITEDGSNPELGSVYGLYESNSDQYPARTKENVSKSDATIIFTKGNSPGSALTKRTCENLKRSVLMLNPDTIGAEKQVGDFIRSLKAKMGRAIVLNIAGNRESGNPGIEKKVENILYAVFSQ